MLEEFVPSAQQQQAGEVFETFIEAPANEWQVFRLDGPAGSGKTRMAQWLARKATQNGGYVLYAAYTGKASEVLRQKGCYPSSTIHGLIYVPESDENHWDLEQMNMELHALRKVFVEPTPKMLALEKQITEAARNLEGPSFGLNYESMLWGAKLLVIDEHSMVDEDMGRDLLSFGVKILALGDTFQLPPVEGDGFFMRGRPDFELTEIHRQAEGSSVLYLAGVARAGRSLPGGEFEGVDGPSFVKSIGNIEDVMAADQVLCGKNQTRVTINRMYREAKGYNGRLPVIGEKMIGLRNDKRTGLRNGTLWTVLDVGIPKATTYGEVVDVRLQSEDGDRTIRGRAWVDCINGDDMRRIPYNIRKEYLEITFGYAMTVHKAQGSQWPHVLLVDESRVFREDEHRHRYTGLTRAAKTVTVVRGVV